MTEVLERLKAEVTRLRRELERAAVELVHARDLEAKDRPGSFDRAASAQYRAQMELDCWSLGCQLAGAVAALAVKEAEVEHDRAQQRRRGGPTAAWLDQWRQRFEAHLARAKQAAEEMVARATDQQAARSRLQEQARQREEARQRQEQEQSQEL